MVPNLTISEILGMGKPVLLYERLNVSIPTTETVTKRKFQIVWMGVHNKEETMHTIDMPGTYTVLDLLKHLRYEVTLSPGTSARIKLFQVGDRKKQLELSSDSFLEDIPEKETLELYAEV
jgi:ubiquitin carboxyl-terminal hydrolase 7